MANSRNVTCKSAGVPLRETAFEFECRTTGYSHIDIVSDPRSCETFIYGYFDDGRPREIDPAGLAKRYDEASPNSLATQVRARWCR